jgi:dTDP-4-dehydrorhamnose reductase
VKVLVTGAGGLLGQEVWRVFGEHHELFAVGRNQPPHVGTAQWQSVDLTDAAHTYAAVTRLNPDWVIHCAAYNNVDRAQTHPDEAYQGNALATRNLALACQRFDTVLMNVSSDYVFDGQSAPQDGYREFDATRPINHYGESKRWAELFVEQLLNKFFIVRTSWLFGPGRPTWIDQVASRSQDGQPIQAATDLVSAPTYTPDLAEGMLRLADSHHFGIVHLTNTGFCSRVELAEEVLRIHRRSGYAKLQKLALADIRLPASRPSFSGLQNLAWRIDGFPPLRPWKEALEKHFSKVRISL